MQRCPKCNRAYQDDSQKFCTFDGGRLMVDTEAPTTFDLGPAPRTDPLGATVMEPPAPDLNKTVASAQPSLTSEIPASAPTGPTNQPPAWPGASSSSGIESAPTLHTPQPTGPTTTSPLTPPPPAQPEPPATAPVPPLGMVSGAPVSAPNMSVPAVTPPATPQSGALPTAAPGPSAPAKKSSAMPLILGGLVVLLLLLVGGGAAFYFLAMRPKVETAANTSGGPSLEKGTPGSSNANASNNNTGNSNTGATTSQPPVEAPPNSTKFTNSRDKLTGSLAEHFVDFSLYYPNSWTLDPKAGTSGSGNFFKADRTLSDSTGDYLLESAAVSWYQSNGTMQLDRAIFPNRVEFFNNLFSKDYPNYQKTSEGETKFNGLDGYQFTFKSLVKGTGKGDVNIWGRVIFLPVGSEEAHNGIVLLTLASSAAPEIQGATDVGEKGELPVILKTFRLGSSQ